MPIAFLTLLCEICDDFDVGDEYGHVMLRKGFRQKIFEECLRYIQDHGYVHVPCL